MQSCNTPCTGTEYPIHMGTVPLKEEEEEEEEAVWKCSPLRKE